MEHRAVVRFFPVIRRLLPPGDGEIFPTRSQHVLHYHGMLTLRPGVQPLSNAPTDGLGCSDMSGLLHDHRLKDDKPLRFPQSVPHPLELHPQRPNEPAPNSPTWRVIAPRWHGRKVTPPLLPRRVVTDASVQMCAWIGMNPVSIDLPET